jgi:hypothetical protein
MNKKEETVVDILDKHFEKKSIKKPIKKSIDKKDIKKLENTVIKSIHKPEIEKPVKTSEEKTPEIEYIIKKTTKFDLNWFYLKKLFVKFERWLISPYTKYTIWFNKKFNNPVIETHFLNTELLPIKEDIKPQSPVIIYQKKKLLEKNKKKPIDKLEIIRSDK